MTTRWAVRASAAILLACTPLSPALAAPASHAVQDGAVPAVPSADAICVPTAIEESLLHLNSALATASVCDERQRLAAVTPDWVARCPEAVASKLVRRRILLEARIRPCEGSSNADLSLDEVRDRISEASVLVHDLVTSRADCDAASCPDSERLRREQARVLRLFFGAVVSARLPLKEFEDHMALVGDILMVAPGVGALSSLAADPKMAPLFPELVPLVQLLGNQDGMRLLQAEMERQSAKSRRRSPTARKVLTAPTSGAAIASALEGLIEHDQDVHDVVSAARRLLRAMRQQGADPNEKPLALLVACEGVDRARRCAGLEAFVMRLWALLSAGTADGTRAPIFLEAGDARSWAARVEAASCGCVRTPLCSPDREKAAEEEGVLGELRAHGCDGILGVRVRTEGNGEARAEAVLRFPRLEKAEGSRPEMTVPGGPADSATTDPFPRTTDPASYAAKAAQRGAARELTEKLRYQFDSFVGFDLSDLAELKAITAPTLHPGVRLDVRAPVPPPRLVLHDRGVEVTGRCVPEFDGAVETLLGTSGYGEAFQPVRRAPAKGGLQLKLAGNGKATECTAILTTKPGRAEILGLAVQLRPPDGQPSPSWKDAGEDAARVLVDYVEGHSSQPASAWGSAILSGLPCLVDRDGGANDAAGWTFAAMDLAFATVGTAAALLGFDYRNQYAAGRSADLSRSDTAYTVAALALGTLVLERLTTGLLYRAGVFDGGLTAAPRR